MINVAYYDKPLIFTGATVSEALAKDFSKGDRSKEVGKEEGGGNSFQIYLPTENTISGFDVDRFDST